jgi:hypothetical protein
MPYKVHEPRRHKIPRARYKVRNWPEGAVAEVVELEGGVISGLFNEP